MLQEAVTSKSPNARVVGRYGSDAQSPLHSMLGLRALVETMADFGVGAEALFSGTGITPKSIVDSQARISHRQKIALFENVRTLTPEPAVALLAGQRQRMSDMGVFGYAILSSATFAEAIEFGMRHLRLAGPVLEKSFRVEGDLAIFEGHEYAALGPLLPVATEFWFSSIQAMLSRTLDRPFEARRLLLPYAPPEHAHRYEEILRCAVEFDAPMMQWEFDASLLPLPLPAANPIMAEVSAAFCGRMLEEVEGEQPLVKSIKEACLNSVGGIPRAEQMAERLHLSTRTLHRRLVEAGTSYQEIIDGVRSRLAIEFLERTDLSADEIAERVGFSDVSNFRKAFRKWTGQTTTFYRTRRH
ncbi:AraC family transcriptional regulator [Variovorax sp. J22R133]|uniref:AraC family transcriptional regulator n=1 Tax=Variovorax brevis TaxID=3053503 RepID=UPI002574DE81|nr:AraC family transcriptional regulator [Variovorax sp. J22R133]MDM0114972.1 AraC family transcriptional regulator [Variovorax sp. J22R133]